MDLNLYRLFFLNNFSDNSQSIEVSFHYPALETGSEVSDLHRCGC